MSIINVLIQKLSDASADNLVMQSTENSIKEKISQLKLSEQSLTQESIQIHLIIKYCSFDVCNLLNSLQTLFQTLPTCTLISLCLSHNGLQQLPSALPTPLEQCFLRHLQELDLSHNRLTTLPPWFGTHLPHLQKLRIDFNHINKIPSFMSHLRGLTKFFCVPNSLPALPLTVQKNGAAAILAFLIEATQSLPDPDPSFSSTTTLSSLSTPSSSSSSSSSSSNNDSSSSSLNNDSSSNQSSSTITKRPIAKDYRFPKRRMPSASLTECNPEFLVLLRSLGLEPFAPVFLANKIDSRDKLASETPEHLSKIIAMPPALCGVLLTNLSNDHPRRTPTALPTAGGASVSDSPAAAMAQPLPRGSMARPSYPPSSSRARSTVSAAAAIAANSLQKSQRVSLISEFLQTELTYNAVLSSLLSDYLEPLRDSQAIGAYDIQLLFAGVPELRAFSSQLLTAVSEETQRAPEDPMLGTILLPLFGDENYECSQEDPVTQMFAGFIIRMVQMNQRLNALATTNATFASVMSTCHSVQSGRGMLGLNSLLVAPFQRICRYILLLKDLHKQTSPEHPDWEALTKLFQRVSKLVQTVNDLKAHQDQMLSLDKLLVGDLNAVRESSLVLKKANIESMHRWIKREKLKHLGSRCVECRQFFRWPTDESCFGCLKCAVIAHKECTRHLSVGCQEPSLLNNSERTFTGNSWSHFSYTPHPKGGSLSRKCTVLLFSDSLLVTSDFKAGEQAELIAFVRWYSFSKQKEIVLQRKSPTKLVIWCPRSGEAHALSVAPKNIEDLSAFVQRVEVVRLEWNLLHPQDPVAAKPTKRASVVIKDAHLTLPDSGIRFSCIQSTKVAQPGGDVVGYVLHVTFLGQTHALTLLPSDIVTFHRFLKHNRGEEYLKLLTKHSRPSKKRNLCRGNLFHQQKCCRKLTNWFNQILALDGAIPLLQDFVDSVTNRSTASSIQVESEEDDQPTPETSSTSADVPSITEPPRSLLNLRLDSNLLNANMMLNMPLFLTETEPLNLPTLGKAATALYDFEPLSSEEVGLIQGEHINVILEADEWVKIVNSTFKIGWVPLNHIQINE